MICFNAYVIYCTNYKVVFEGHVLPECNPFIFFQHIVGFTNLFGNI